MKPSLSRSGHRRIINELKARAGKLQQELEEGINQLKLKDKPSNFTATLSNATNAQLIGASILGGTVVAGATVASGGVAVIAGGIGAATETVGASTAAATRILPLIPPVIKALQPAH